MQRPSSEQSVTPPARWDLASLLGDRTVTSEEEPTIQWLAVLLVLLGGTFGVWHATVLLSSLGLPAVALLGTVVLLGLSTLLVALGLWSFRHGPAPSLSGRIAGWVVVTVAAFGVVGVLVALHLDHMLPRFDPAPLVADLVTVGAGMGLLVGQYDARSRRYQSRMREERDRFASLFDNLPNLGLHYVLVDGEPVVRDTNAAFEEVFGIGGEVARGTAVNDLVVPDTRATEASEIDRHLAAGEAVQTEVQRLTATGLRDFQLSVVPYRADEGFSIAVDVTERKQHVRRLEVLNRVLRHDLRTDANVIVGMADRLPDSETAETIRERAFEMAERGEAARRIDRALDRTTERRPVDLGRLLRDRVESVEGATVHTDIEGATVFGSGALGEAIDELLENTVKHADDEPTVWVRTRVEGAFAVVEVADDGPGIPEMERSVLEAGEETPLQHSSGLGLWFVRFVVADLGGEVTVRDREPRGTVVALALPRTEPTGRSDGA